MSLKYSPQQSKLDKELPPKPHGLPASPRSGKVHFEPKRAPYRPRRPKEIPGEIPLTPVPPIRLKKGWESDRGSLDRLSRLSKDTRGALWEELRDTKEALRSLKETVQDLDQKVQDLDQNVVRLRLDSRKQDALWSRLKTCLLSYNNEEDIVIGAEEDQLLRGSQEGLHDSAYGQEF
ncbi:hypothetical protein EG329_003770 [Mollisiaceae sp. DMI_Dod_QoI]|nr:hypothetical protein EG329_003770 [Helotiales sp. DMI_Dod_QoI]